MDILVAMVTNILVAMVTNIIVAMVTNRLEWSNIVSIVFKC